MRSMTGYGRGEVPHGGLKFTVELNSVNRKQADIVVDLPRDLIELEPRIRDEINAVIWRGRLHVVITWHRAGEHRSTHVAVDSSLARAYVRAMKELQRTLKVSGEITLNMLARLPGLFQVLELSVHSDEVWIYIQKALKQALGSLVRMREKEGGHLRKDFSKRIGLLEDSIQIVQKYFPGMVERYRKQLFERIRQAGIEAVVHDERLLKEVALFADRSDLTEELTRLNSHLKQFRENLNAAGPIGRTLDFLAQEINREVNTIGSKANDIQITQTVVVMKSEVERIREQIQNVE